MIGSITNTRNIIEIIDCRENYNNNNNNDHHNYNTNDHYDIPTNTNTDDNNTYDNRPNYHKNTTTITMKTKTTNHTSEIVRSDPWLDSGFEPSTKHVEGMTPMH